MFIFQAFFLKIGIIITLLCFVFIISCEASYQPQKQPNQQKGTEENLLKIFVFSNFWVIKWLSFPHFSSLSQKLEGSCYIYQSIHMKRQLNLLPRFSLLISKNVSLTLVYFTPLSSLSLFQEIVKISSSYFFWRIKPHQ